MKNCLVTRYRSSLSLLIGTTVVTVGVSSIAFARDQIATEASYEVTAQSGEPEHMAQPMSDFVVKSSNDRLGIAIEFTVNLPKTLIGSLEAPQLFQGVIERRKSRGEPFYVFALLGSATCKADADEVSCRMSYYGPYYLGQLNCNDVMMHIENKYAGDNASLLQAQRASIRFAQDPEGILRFKTKALK